MLEQISGLSAEEAKKELVTSLKDEAKSDAMAFVQTSVEEAKLTAEQEARKISFRNNTKSRCRASSRKLCICF